MLLRPILAALAGLSALALTAPEAEAADRFAMTCFENKTNITLRYSTKWGESGKWKSHTLASGSRTSHTYEFPRGKENRAPRLYVKFDDDLSSKVKKRDYVLESFSSPQTTDCKRYGKEYVFRYDGSAKKFVDLRAVR